MEGINEYILDRSIAELPGDSIQEFWDIDYGMFERGYGIVRIFPGEVFYSAKNNIFLGRECIHTVVAALNGKIYKVLFRFISPSTQEYDAFREDACNYLTGKFGPPTKTRRPSEFEKISIWDGDFGNVILDINMLGTSVIYTSSMLRPRKKSLLQRLFGSYWLRQTNTQKNKKRGARKPRPLSASALPTPARLRPPGPPMFDSPTIAS